MVSKRWLAIFLGAAVGAWGAVLEKELTLPTRPGVTVGCVVDRDDGQPPTRIMVLLNNHTGKVRLQAPEGVASPFLVRARTLFAQGGTASVLVDVPSDWPFGMNENFRESEDHAADLDKVLDGLQARYPSVREFVLVGAGMGSVSAIHAGARLQGRLAGIVLAGAYSYYLELSPEVLDQVQVPVLVVQHREDGCPQSAFDRAEALADQYHFTLAPMEGGLDPVSGPCDGGGPHGFFGVEAQVAEAIRVWLDGRP